MGDETSSEEENDKDEMLVLRNPNVYSCVTKIARYSVLFLTSLIFGYLLLGIFD